MTTSEFWKQYLRDTNQNENEAVYSGELVFEDEGMTGRTQLSMVLSGSKTAMFTPLETIEINMEKMPVTGEVYVVLDTNDEPRCVIELTDVRIIPLNEISWELARKDGEDEDMQDWKEKMEEFLEEEADLCGFEALPDSKIVCEIFKLIYKK
ncbi:MAG: ASCH domain-containing protein [Treponema sp.]|nr:ASCH domain-containing protein [Treponema sp.]